MKPQHGLFLPLSSSPTSNLLPFILLLAAATLGCGEKTPATTMKDFAPDPRDFTFGFMDDDLYMVPGPDMAFDDLAMECKAMEAAGKGKTGDPCTISANCMPGKGMGQPGRCVSMTMELGQLITWPNGYCSPVCDPDLNQAMNFGINPECPGGNATCIGAANTAHCVALCTNSDNCRPCYRCFNSNDASHGCLPQAVSACDPTSTTSCPFGNAGTRLVCENLGYGDVGRCVAPCDPYAGKGCPGGGGGKDCHANDITGQGFCTSGSLSGLGAGGDCVGFPANECPTGYGCLNNKCWKYCNDSNRNVQCIQGARCMPMPSGKSPTSVIGICEMSK